MRDGTFRPSTCGLPGSKLLGMPSKVPMAPVTLPRPVVDRIHRYAEEGRVPLVRYERDQCLLLAVAKWQPPAVLLRSSRAKFTGMRTAALMEWARTSRRKRRSA